jgi:hypothetical protein
MNTGYGDRSDDGLTWYGSTLYADDLCLSFFSMFARRSKSHSCPAAGRLQQPRGAMTSGGGDGDGELKSSVTD